jgi:glycerate 2-kinase
VIAGEGCIDDQSFGGKIVGELVRRAHAAHVAIHAVVGSNRLTDEQAAEAGLTRVWTASTLAEITAAARALAVAER